MVVYISSVRLGGEGLNDRGWLSPIFKIKIMTKQELQIKKMAFEIVGLHMDEAALEAFELVSEVYKKKKEDFDLKDACIIKAKLHKKYGSRRVMYSMDLID